jgi:hypothetical protein
LGVALGDLDASEEAEGGGLIEIGFAGLEAVAGFFEMDLDGSPKIGLNPEALETMMNVVGDGVPWSVRKRLCARPDSSAVELVSRLAHLGEEPPPTARPCICITTLYS